MDDPPRVVTPPTDRQLRALHAGFANLGYRRRSDRTDRLIFAAETLGMSQLDSFTDLTAGQAGYLLGLLRRGELPGIAAAYREPESEARVGRAAEIGNDVTDLENDRWKHATLPIADRGAAAASCAAIGAAIILAAGQARQHLAMRRALLAAAAAQSGPG